MDLISIVVPVYNAEKYIGICVNSVLEQTYNNFELLLINDGSKDDTLEVLNSYKDSRIKVYSFDNHLRNCVVIGNAQHSHRSGNRQGIARIQRPCKGGEGRCGRRSFCFCFSCNHYRRMPFLGY